MDLSSTYSNSVIVDKGGVPESGFRQRRQVATDNRWVDLCAGEAVLFVVEASTDENNRVLSDSGWRVGTFY